MTRTARFAFVVLASVAAANAAPAQSVGPNNSGTTASDPGSPVIGSVAWNGLGNAVGPSDGVSAFAGVGAGAASEYLKATNFGFALDPAAIVLGIQVDIQKQTGSGTVHDNAVRIVKGGTIGTTDRSDGNAWPTPTPPPTTYGGPTDLWGESWTAADINASGFGVAISARDSVSGALAQVDSFAITVFYALCGDGIITSPTEQCDDGNTDNGDCCSSTCQFESEGSPCTDNDACTAPDGCDGAGSCNPGPPITCDDSNPCTQDSCNSLSGCVYDTAPRGGCRTALKATLLIKENGVPAKNKLVWKWIKGQATTFSDFGNLGTPSGTTAYTLCVYQNTNATPAGVIGLTVPDSSTKWTVIGANKGDKYKDPSGTDDGVTKALLKAGANGKAKALMKAKGGSMPSATLGLTTPVVAQLVNSENNACYTTQFNSAKKNTTAQFKAKAP
jgi:cysteine-rich repeat protein